MLEFDVGCLFEREGESVRGGVRRAWSKPEEKKKAKYLAFAQTTQPFCFQMPTTTCMYTHSNGLQAHVSGRPERGFWRAGQFL